MKPLGRDDFSCTIESLKPYIQYEYEIKACNKSLEGGSITDTAQTEAGCPEQPLRPALKIIDSESVSVEVRKLEPEHENGKPVTSVHIERSLDKKVWSSCGDVSPATDQNKIKKTFTFCCIGSGNLLIYKYFRAQMKNEVGLSKPSSEASIETTDLIPSAPRDLQVVSAMSGPTKMQLAWDAPLYHAESVCRYSIEVKSNEPDKVSSTPNSPFVVSTLLPNTCYKVRVTFRNEKKLGESCEEIEYCTPYAPPCPPSREQVSMQVISDKDLKWSIQIPRVPSGQKKISFVMVEKCDDNSGQDWDFDGEESVTCPESGIMEFVTNYKKYMRLRYKSDVGISEPSGVVTVPSAQRIPGVPINLEVSNVKATSIGLCWNKPQANRDAANKYRIEYMEKGGINWTKVFSVDGLHCDIGSNIIRPCHTFLFKICAKNEKNVKGEYCDHIEVKTPPIKPHSPGIPMETYKSAQLSIMKTDLDGVDTVCVETKEYENDVEWEIIRIKRDNFVNDCTKAGYLVYTMTFKGTPIVWRIKTCSGDMESDYCDELKMTPAQFIPLPPTGVKVTEKSQSHFNIMWDTPIDISERIEKYEVFVHNTKNGSREQRVVSKGTYTTSFSELDSATKYKIEVVSTNNCSKQGTTIEENTNWPLTGPPLGLRAAGATRSLVKIRWHPPKDEKPVFKYNIYYKTSDSEHYLFYKAVPRVMNSVLVEELESYTKYDFKVASVNRDEKEGGYAESKQTRTKRSKAARFGIEAALILPTLALGSVAASFKMGSDDDVRDSYGHTSS